MRSVTTSAADSGFFAMMFSRYRYVLNCPTTTPKISSSPLGRMTGSALLVRTLDRIIADETQKVGTSKSSHLWNYCDKVLS
jgi:hypothetical protein